MLYMLLFILQQLRHIWKFFLLMNNSSSVSNWISCIKILYQLLILSILSLSSGFLFFSHSLRCFLFLFFFSFFVSLSFSPLPLLLFFSHKPNEIRKDKRKKRNPDEGERIDKIRNWYNILMQEIQLLMYSSWSDLMRYYLFEKKFSDIVKLLEHE